MTNHTPGEFVVNGPLAYFDRGNNRLADKLVKLLLIHNRCRTSAPTRLPGIKLAIETVRARLLAVDTEHRRAA